MFHKNSYLAIAPFLFILVGVFCEVAVVRGVCILCAFRGTLFFLRVQMYTFSSTFIIRFKPLCDTLLLCQGYCWIGKNTNKKFRCVMAFYNGTKYYFEVPIYLLFQWMSMSKENLFLTEFWTFLVLCLSCACYNFWFYDINDFNSLLPLSCRWIKSLNSKTTKYIPKCWERFVK